MRMNDLFANFDELMSEDYDAVLRNADQAIQSAKKQKKSAEISALRDKTSDKQRELASMSGGAQPIKPIQPIKPKTPK